MVKCGCKVLSMENERFDVSLVSVPRIGEKIKKSPFANYMVVDVIYYDGVATVDLHVVETI